VTRYTPKDIKAIIAELTSNNDRAKAVVGGALMDSILDYAIRARVLTLPEPEENKLFSLAGPFGTCDQKIQGAFALGLFGSKTRTDLVLINRIRNEFAHDLNPISFDEERIAGRCRAIHTATNSDSHDQGLWREKFVLAVQILLDALAGEANEGAGKLKMVSHLLSD